MTVAVDTSVALAGILAKHEHHDVADEALARATATIVHVALETYSVLTRLPPPRRLEPQSAGAVMDARLPTRWLGLAPGDERRLIRELAAAGVAGGATYDGLIALTAREHSVELVSLDRRAARTYRTLGVGFSILTA